MVSKAKSLLKYIFMFCLGGVFYYLFECMIRGFSHWTMFLLGGLCFMVLSFINQCFSIKLSLLRQMLLSSIMITFLELITGLIVNVWLKWNIWDYSHIPANFMGQICLPFSIVWFALSLVAIILDDYIRYFFFGEEKVHHRWR